MRGTEEGEREDKKREGREREKRVPESHREVRSDRQRGK